MCVACVGLLVYLVDAGLAGRLMGACMEALFEVAKCDETVSASFKPCRVRCFELS